MLDCKRQQLGGLGKGFGRIRGGMGATLVRVGKRWIGLRGWGWGRGRERGRAGLGLRIRDWWVEMREGGGVEGSRG